MSSQTHDADGAEYMTHEQKDRVDAEIAQERRYNEYRESLRGTQWEGMHASDCDDEEPMTLEEFAKYESSVYENPSNEGGSDWDSREYDEPSGRREDGICDEISERDDPELAPGYYR